MKVLVTSTGKDLESQIAPKFGRCGYCLFVETVTMDYEAVINENASAYSGAGIEIAQSAIDRGVKVVITQNICECAYEDLVNAGITVIANGAGKVRRALDRLIEGGYEEAQFACV